jgi:hypothetical protein
VGSQNILDIDPHGIAETKVLLTMVGGKVVRDARRGQGGGARALPRLTGPSDMH